MTKNLREEFENKEKEDQSASQELSDFVENKINEFPQYSSWQSGGLMRLNVVDTDHLDDVEAFILNKGYSKPSAGIEESYDFGIVKNGQMINDGFTVTRSGTASGYEDSSKNYNTIKILNSTIDKVVIGVKGHEALDILSIDINLESMSSLESYDLASEAAQVEQERLRKEATQTEDFEEKLKLYESDVSKDIRNSYRTSNEVYEVDGKKFGLITVASYDRDCDASVQSLHFFVLEEGADKANDAGVLNLSYDTSYKWSSKFFSVDAHKTVGDLEIKDKFLKIPVDVEVIGSFNAGSPGNGHKSNLGKNSITLDYKLRD